MRSVVGLVLLDHNYLTWDQRVVVIPEEAHHCYGVFIVHGVVSGRHGVTHCQVVCVFLTTTLTKFEKTA